MPPQENAKIAAKLLISLKPTFRKRRELSNSGARMQASVPVFSTDNLYQFFAVAFSAAPGVTYMGQLLDAASAGMSIKEIVNVFTTKDQFTSVYPTTLPNAEFATRLVNSVVGASATAQAKQSAVDDILAALALPGWSRGDVIFAVFTNLAGKPAADPDWSGTSAKMKNQVIYARYYTEVMKGDTTAVATLQKVIAAVTQNSNTSNGIEQAILAALAPALTVNVSLSQPKATVGSSVTLTWSSTNAASCTGLDSMTAGAQPTSGSAVITPTVGGQFTYTLSCVSAGGTTNNSALLIVPIPVMRSSYENKIMAGEKLGPVPHPPTQVLTPPPKEERISLIAMGDFFQEGVLSSVVFSNQEDGIIPSWTPGKVYFFKYVNGQWIDNTSKLLSDNAGCISPRKILVADFNGDGKPDVFASCTGHDAVVDGKLPGEHPRFLLSQPDGTYKNVESSLNCYCHSATAADFKGDGYADLIVQDNANDGLIYLINNRDGTFSKDRSQLPNSAMNFGIYAHGIWTVELMDIRNAGRYDLFLGGVDLINCDCSWSWTSKIYYNEQNRWTDNSMVILPSVPGKVEVYDVMVRAGNIYQLRPDWGNGTVASNSMAIQKVDVNTLQSSIIYEHSGAFSNGYTTVIDWFIYHDGKIKNLFTYPDVQVSLLEGICS